MLGELNIKEVQLLNSYEMLGNHGQKELDDYVRYLLCKQYKREVLSSVFNNKLIHNLFHSLLHLVDKEDFDVYHVVRRIAQIKELYYGTFEQVHVRYSEMIDELDSNEVVREFGRTMFENIEEALKTSNRSKIKYEIIGFYEEFNKLAKKKDARIIVAV